MGLAFHWVFLHMGLWAWIQKMGINIQLPEHMDFSCNSYAKTDAVFFCRLFHHSHANASLFFFAGLLFQPLLSLGKSFSFFLQIHDPPRVAKKSFSSCGWWFVVVTPKCVYCKLCLFWACCMLSFCQIPVAQYYHWAFLRMGLWAWIQKMDINTVLKGT